MVSRTEDASAAEVNFPFLFSEEQLCREHIEFQALWLKLLHGVFCSGIIFSPQQTGLSRGALVVPLKHVYLTFL